MADQLKFTETESENPICPHCESEIKEVFARKVKGGWSVSYIYFCSMCKKVIGATDRKSIWAG